MINISKIKNDKYYTSSELAKYIVNKTKEIIGEENIIEYLEPSAGSGVFLDYLPPNTLAYDIEPEDKLHRIIKQDYLTLDLNYKKGRCIIGNPPYGERMNLAVQFYKKSIQLGDYIAFILPISQLDNNFRMFEFDLIYSENLGKQLYSGKEVFCCFNIYKRPNNGKLKKRPNYDLKEVEIKEGIRGSEKRQKIVRKSEFDYDIAICAWGSACGKELDYEGQYAQEFYIKTYNEKYKDKVTKLIKNTIWKDVFPMLLESNKLQKWKVYKYIKEQIPEIE